MLTPHQWQVVGLVADGMTNAEIAHRLRNSENMAKHWLTDIYDATGMSNRVELTNWFNREKDEKSTADILAGVCC